MDNQTAKNTSGKINKSLADKLGMMFSGLCLGHCLLTPALVLLVGSEVFGFALASEWPHRVFLVFALLMAALSFPKTWRQTRSVLLMGIAGIGVMGLVASALVHGPIELVFTVIGSIFLIAAHVMNMHLSSSLLPAPLSQMEQ